MAGGADEEGGGDAGELGLSTTNASHNKLITAAARAHLSPFGCTQKGRSRTWLLDRTWFVSIVEFQPSSFGKGTFLNVGAHFLWTQDDHLSFDLGHRIDEFEGYESDEQFAEVADRYARRALAELKALDAKLPHPGAAAHALPKRTNGVLPVRLNRAISHALEGETIEAAKLFDSLTTRPKANDWEQQLVTYCTELLGWLNEPELFRRHIAKVIAEHRRVLGLPANSELVDLSLRPPPPGTT